MWLRNGACKHFTVPARGRLRNANLCHLAHLSVSPRDTAGEHPTRAPATGKQLLHRLSSRRWHRGSVGRVKVTCRKIEVLKPLDWLGATRNQRKEMGRCWSSPADGSGPALTRVAVRSSGAGSESQHRGLKHNPNHELAPVTQNLRAPALLKQTPTQHRQAQLPCPKANWKTRASTRRGKSPVDKSSGRAGQTDWPPASCRPIEIGGGVWTYLCLTRLKDTQCPERSHWFI